MNPFESKPLSQRHVSSRRGRRSREAVGIVGTIALVAGLVSFVPSLLADTGPSTPGFAAAVRGTSGAGTAGAHVVAPVSAPIETSRLAPGSHVIDLASVDRANAREGRSSDARQWHPIGDTGMSLAVADSHATGGDGDVVSVAQLEPAHPANVTATVLTSRDAAAVGASSLALRLKAAGSRAEDGSVDVRIPKRLLSGLYGADYLSRLTWVQTASNASTKVIPASLQPRVETVRRALSSRSVGSDIVVTAVLAASSPTILTAVASGSSASGTGDFGATSLKPASSWDVSAQTGTFSWDYPLRVPPAPAGPVPDVALSYDSQSVDGLTGSTNNQPSAIGEGWALDGTGFIERSYVGCATDDGPSGPVTTSGDLCFKSANATVSFAGHSGALVQVGATNQYRLANDDGTRFTELTGAPCQSNGTSNTACWQMVTPDGTQYFFGLNRLPGWSSGKPTTNSAWTVPVFGNDPGEPCHAATFASSACDLGWRWNVDYVVDVHGNAEAFYYNAQTNMYARGGSTPVSYVRGGEVEHIEYGLTSTNVFAPNAATGRVEFSYDANGRCSDGAGSACTPQPASGPAAKPSAPASYPDVPFDQLCTSGTCADHTGPTFWTTSRLSSVKTQVQAGGSYKDVDSWSLKHTFPAPGDGTSAALWLASITHTGYAGGSSLTEPTVTFAGTTMQNRVWAVDGLAPLDKWRISSIKSELGGTTSVNYSGQECTPSDRGAIFANPAANTKRCYPQWWSPSTTPPQPAQQDLFHKYVVTSTVDNPNTGGAGAAGLPTYYFYGTPGWRYNDSPLTPADRRTWSSFAGFNTAEERAGDPDHPADQSVTKYTFFQGLDGDRAAPAGGTRSVSVTGSSGVADSLQYAGRTREVVQTNGVGGPTLSRTVVTPWSSPPTASDGYRTARYTNDAETVVSEPVSTGGDRTTSTKTVADPVTGLTVSEQVAPSDAPATCTTTTYAAPNPVTGVIGSVAEVLKTSGTCDQAASAGADRLISDVRTSYDGQAVGAAPTFGDATRTEVVSGFVGSVKTWTTASTTSYDSLGRPTQTTDSAGRVTKSAYTPAGAGAPTTATQVTNPLGWTTSTTVEPAWGVELSVTDENGKVTSSSYDALGRRTAVWLPSQPQASNPTSPSTKYTYTVSQTAPSVVTTETALSDITRTSYELVDGLGRTVQTQGRSPSGGSVISDTVYDTQGRSVSSLGPYWATANPSTSLFVPTSWNQVPTRTDTRFDAAGRTLTSVLYTFGDETKRTSYAYPGADRVDVTPPAGAAPSTTISNSIDQRTSLTQYSGESPTGDGLTTRYEYDFRGSMSAMVDTVGNRWSWAFDTLGNQVSATDPDTGTTTSTYDLAGNVLTTTDARGQTLAFTYDQLNRTTGKYSGSSSGPILASWVYDTVAKGQSASATSYVGSTAGKPGLAYTTSVGGYDNFYNATSTTVSIPAGAPAFAGTTYTVASAFARDGSMIQRSLPAAGGLPSERLRVLYDGVGNVDSITGSSTYGIASYTPLSQISQIARKSTTSLYTGFGYDPGTGEATEVIDTTQIGAVWTQQADRQFKRDASGNVTAIATTGASGADTQCFGYDRYQNMTEAWTPGSGDCTAAPSVAGLGGAAPYWKSYAVDPATGNRLSTTSHTAAGDAAVSFSYPAAGAARPHAVTAVADGAYGYDASGSIVSRPGQQLDWDESGRLSKVTSGAGTESRVYDADGSLLLSTDSKGSKLFLGDTELSVPSGSSVVSGVRTYSFGGVPVAERSAKSGVSGSSLTWLSGDLNRTQDLSVGAAAGKVVRRFVDPFGNPRGEAASWQSEHGYLNASASAVTGLTQLGARAYDPVVGRFMSVDPVLDASDPAQSNGYSYAHNSPVSLSDPSGLKPSTSKSKSTPGSSKTKSSSKGSSAKKKEDWNPFSWSGETWQKIGAVAAGVVAAVAITAAVVGAAACTAATLGVCGAALLIGGAVGGAVGNLLTYQLQPGPKSTQGQIQALTFGAIGGLVTAGAGGALAMAGGKALGAIAGKVASAEGKAGSAGTVARTFESSDAHVADAANAMEAAAPGSVKGVNSYVKMADGGSREVDIDLGNILVQVKGGNARGITGQIERTSSTTGRTTIGYAPDMPGGAWEAAARKGIPIARNGEELVAMVKELR
ncbi:RHS repeat-associated core domain-containing protein [Leifsonia sp. LS-T14]|uniref:RHS repeat domain-containing protein n=1 Tax=unclassified Leifsonia TaxID=2663824 RepID=UPI0035A7366D